MRINLILDILYVIGFGVAIMGIAVIILDLPRRDVDRLERLERFERIDR